MDYLQHVKRHLFEVTKVSLSLSTEVLISGWLLSFFESF